MYGMTNDGKLFANEINNFLIEGSQCQMSIYYKYEPFGSRLVVLFYVDGCVYWYTYE